MLALGSPGGSVVKNLPANTVDAGDTGSISGSGRALGGGNRPTTVFLSVKSQGRGTWHATVHGDTKESDTTDHSKLVSDLQFFHSTIK